jgi:hypothetical protein
MEIEKKKTPIFNVLMGSRSQAFQESFVQNVLNFKEHGHFLEIGAGDGVEASNTFILEKQYKWKGIAVEFDSQLHQDFMNSRTTICFCEDATIWDANGYLESLSFPRQIDYLQIDIDPAWQSLRALRNLSLDRYRFSVITFEHDYYINQNPDVRDASRKILLSHGYHLFFGGVQTQGRNFEDWWLDSENTELRKYIDLQFEDLEAKALFNAS